MKNSLKQLLYNHWKSKEEWIAGGEAERIALSEGYKASNASRRLRELCEENKLERQLRPMRSGGRTVFYRVKLSNENSPQQSRPAITGTYKEIESILHSLRQARTSGTPPLPKIYQQSLAI